MKTLDLCSCYVSVLHFMGKKMDTPKNVHNQCTKK